MIPVVMYHHINSDDLPLSNSDAMMGAHLRLVSERYKSVFPGEEAKNPICLTTPTTISTITYSRCSNAMISRRSSPFLPPISSIRPTSNPPCVFH